jgi:hypothetical protein
MDSLVLIFFQDFIVYFSLLMIVLGFVGNLFTFKIYHNSALNKNTLSLYFRTISVHNNYQLLHMLRQTILVSKSPPSTHFEFEIDLLINFCEILGEILLGHAPG